MFKDFKDRKNRILPPAGSRPAAGRPALQRHLATRSRSTAVPEFPGSV